MRGVLLLSSMLLAGTAFAQAADYARHWPVETREAGVYAVTLTPALYAQIQHPDLRDLAAFNAKGEALAFGPLAPVWALPEPQWRSAAWFALPPAPAGAEGGVSMQLERRSDGSLSLRAEAGEGGATEPSGEWLVDTGIRPDDKLRLQALAFDFDPAATDFSAQLRIQASDDLETWHPVVDSASVLSLQQGGQRLLRRQIEFGAAQGRYLRLRRLDANTPLPLQGVQVQVRADGALELPASQQLAAELVSQASRTFVYRLPARIPVEQVNLRLPQDNAVAVVHLASREGGRGAWRPRGSLTVFRLRAADVELDNEALWLGGSRDREWRVETSTDLSAPPVLEFSYRPERWLLLTQGEAPYVIAAGSTRAARTDMPLAALIAPIRAKYGQAWQPPELALGQPVVVAGDAAIEASVEERWSGRALWLILIGSALAIGVMVVRLLREQRPAP